MLTRSAFEGAVKDALRHCNQIDLLAGNPLLRARVLAHSDPETANPQAVRALLMETADVLFADEKDKGFFEYSNLPTSARRQSRRL